MALPAGLAGYPYQAIINWQPTASQPYALMITAGDEGKVLTEVDSQGWIKVSVRNATRQGWVPVWAITVGRTRAFGHRQFLHDFPQITALNFNPNSVAGTTVFEKAIRALALAFKLRQADLPFLTDDMRNFLNNDVRREGYIDQLMHDMDTDFVNIVSGTNATVQRLVNRLGPVRANNQKRGFYMRVTSRFRANLAKPAEFYIGKTTDGYYSRQKAHRNPVASDNSMAAISVRESELCEMYPICITSSDSMTMAIGEQLLISVTGSYGYLIKDFVSTAATTGQPAMQNLVKTLSNRRIGKLMIEIAAPVFSTVGWVPLCDRPSFGVSRALNYMSPLADKGAEMEKLLWIRTEEPGVKQTFHRPACNIKDVNNQRFITVLAGREYADVVNPNSTSKSRVTYTLRKDEDFANPSKDVKEVYVVYEIQLNGPHPVPWARLPEVGCYSDWHWANHLGMRLEWEDKGQWYTRNVQKKEKGFMDTDDPGCIRAYAEAMGIIRYLQQVDQEGPRGWDITYGLARVKHLHWDHLNQTARLQEVSPSGKSLKPAVMRPFKDIVRDIQNLGARGVNANWRAWPKDGSMTDGPTRKCDGCYIDNFFEVSDFQAQIHHISANDF